MSQVLFRSLLDFSSFDSHLLWELCKTRYWGATFIFNFFHIFQTTHRVVTFTYRNCAEYNNRESFKYIFKCPEELWIKTILKDYEKTYVLQDMNK